MINCPMVGHCNFIWRKKIMFCFQCEQTAKGKACIKYGACGKDPRTAALQDLIVYSLKGVSMYAHRLGEMGVRDKEIDAFTVESLFTTVTNVNFDPERLGEMLRKLINLRDKAQKLYIETCKEKGKTTEELKGPARLELADNIDDMVKQGESVSITRRYRKFPEDVVSLQELLTYGLKGMAAYTDHAHILGYDDDEVYAFFHRALDYLTREEQTLEDLFALCLECGQYNIRVMGTLDEAHTKTYGHPEPTRVRVTPVKGKAIVVSGHDLKDLEELLKQTQGKGINVYTHGEMLPAHGYPGLKKYDHLVGNYGGAWQDQQKEFDRFPGAILMTTNCIQKPRKSYRDRIFTSGLVAWPGVTHIYDRDFTPVIEAALSAEGFQEDGEEKYVTVGFGHNAVGSVAGKVVSAVKNGDIKHFFLIGGCDGAKSGRNYYTRFAESVPGDCVILTLACGKYRFNKLDFGEIGGIPRLLDVGQCNDAYSAIQIASALAEAFECQVNDLPLSFILSWYEQKAVVILLSLLHLGIKNIRLGPSLPAFITPAVLKILQEKFNIMPISNVEEDLKAILDPEVAPAG